MRRRWHPIWLGGMDPCYTSGGYFIAPRTNSYLLKHYPATGEARVIRFDLPSLEAAKRCATQDSRRRAGRCT